MDVYCEASASKTCGYLKIQMWLKGVAPDITKMLALEDIFRLYKADVKRSYEQIVTAMHALEKSKHHKKIIRDVYKFMDKGCIYQKALNLSLRKHDELFDDIIEDIIDGDEEYV